MVDTPGSDAKISGNIKAIENFLPVADLLVFLFPGDNPWGANTWQLVSRLPREQLKNVVFVLQQADLKSEEDLKEVEAGRGETLYDPRTMITSGPGFKPKELAND